MLIGKGQLFLERGIRNYCTERELDFESFSRHFQYSGGTRRDASGGGWARSRAAGTRHMRGGCSCRPWARLRWAAWRAAAFVLVPSWGTLGAGSQGIPARSAGGTSAAPRYGGYWVLSLSGHC